MDLIELVAFLGNTGKQYERNRHNAAWLFADSLSSVSSLSWSKKFKGESATLNALGRKIQLLKPHTFMNLSGESIAEAASFYKIKPECILVVHDELELPAGTFALKWSGGLGGHNGLRSAKACLGTADFWRLRFGIGRPPHDDVALWVLSDFSKDELPAMNAAFQGAAGLFEALLNEDPKKLLPEWKKRQGGVQ
ncbi:aminoacyl-tRNA hydrolase [Treponema lecithinolyticum]|uniref:aminoacyl-tRNA hydrolase n=1 Tax=Treponema lecithinolyticum TaxID=53418 RepID=UPI0028E42C4E|nr:aminoacyl-tRNA hydrolase [Treponema lecithinolyticum]